ncbi:hypothetical protein JCM6882_005337 [Rhodosporidiobolus microsporus]
MPPSSFRRRTVLVERMEEEGQLEERANDGFWTPGMGEPGFDEATATGQVLAPTVEEAVPTVLVVTVTAEVEVAATTVTQLVQPLETASLPIAASSPAPDASERLFGGASSSAGVGKVLQLSTPAEADEATSTPALLAPAETTSARAQAPTSAAAVPAVSEAAATTSEKIFNAKWDSQVRAVVASTSEAAEPAAVSTTPVPFVVLTQTTSSARSSSRIAVVAPSSSTTPAVESASTPLVDTSTRPVSGLSSLIVGFPSASTTVALAASSSSPLLSASSTSAPSSSARSTASTADSSSPSSSASSASSASSPSSTVSARDSSAGSFFSKLGKSPANIALTTIVSVGILAVLIGILAFFLRRCHRRRKKALLGDLLGSEAGDTPAPKERWTEKFNDEDEPLAGYGAAAGISGGGLAYLDAESPGIEPDEVWRRRLSSTDGHGGVQCGPCGMLTLPARASVVEARRPSAASSEWTSFGGDHRMQQLEQPHPQHGSSAEPAGPKRESESTIGTGILYPSYPSAAYSAYPAFHLPNRLAAPAPPAPAHLQPRPSMQPHLSTISDSIYSTTVPPTPRSPSIYLAYQSAVPLSPALGNVSPTTPAPVSPHSAPPPSPSYFAPRREILAHPTNTTPGIVRTLPSLSGPSGAGMQDPSPASTPGAGTWKESLERVMGSAADLIGSTFSAAPAVATATAGRASDAPRGEFGQRGGNGGDRFTTFPSPASPRRPHLASFSTLRPTRPPPLNLSPAPPPLALCNSHLSLVSAFSDSTAASIEGDPEPETLVSPSTLAFPEKALAHVEEHAHAAKGVRTNLAQARGKKRQDLPRFDPRLMITDERRTQSEPGHGGDEEEGAGAESERKRDSASEQLHGEEPPAVNPFLAPRRPARPRKSSQRRGSLTLPSSSLARPPMMARQRSSSLDGGAVSPFAHPDDSDDEEEAHESDSLDLTSSSSSTHSDDEAASRASEHDKRVSSLMLERRRRSLASLSAAGSISLPGSRSASRVGSRSESTGPVGKKAVEAELRALCSGSRV